MAGRSRSTSTIPRSSTGSGTTPRRRKSPGLGERFGEPGAEREYPLHVARDVRELHRALDALGPSWRNRSVADLLLEAPRYRRTVRRVQSLAGSEYAEIRDNVIGEACLPIDMLRCKLAIFGAGKFDPKSGPLDPDPRSSRVRRCPASWTAGMSTDWAFPVIPDDPDLDDTGGRCLW